TAQGRGVAYGRASRWGVRRARGAGSNRAAGAQTVESRGRRDRDDERNEFGDGPADGGREAGSSEASRAQTGRQTRGRGGARREGRAGSTSCTVCIRRACATASG